MKSESYLITPSHHRGFDTYRVGAFGVQQVDEWAVNLRDGFSIWIEY